ncbi:MAG: hypothetical protein E7612_01075 [Ruminococcaceae bacterium]|nr:hypothetical protein [Oscillospiraceae bacterium]
MKNTFQSIKDKPKEFFELIPQTGVTHVFAMEDPMHNAIWDMAISPEGRVFFSACGESYTPLYARLYEYDHKNKKMIRHFALEDKIILNKNSLRTSKFHTALSFIGDGKILSATHTTSPGPAHPTWMPYEYAEHPYEGYQGSNLVLYDYNTGEAKGLGILSPRDTVYGATYDPKNGDYFAITWLRGTGYVYNIHTGESRCLGQVSDSHTSRTFLLSDGHIYGSTYSGAMFRYNTDIRNIEFLGVSAPGLIRHACEYNGKLYFTTGPCSVAGRGQELYSYDLKTREIKTVGRPVPKIDAITENPSIFYNAYGMAFDSKGVLWYGCMTFVPEHKYAGARLYMWDFLNGKDPVDCGFLGSRERTVSITAEMQIRDDVLYVSDGNHTGHCDTPSGILAIDLEEFVPALKTEKRLMSHDYINYLPYQYEAREWYPKSDFDDCLKLYNSYYENTIKYFEEFVADNSPRPKFSHASGVSVWEKIGFANTEVKNIEWKSNTELEFVCGNKSDSLVEVSLDEKSNAHVVSICSIETKDYSAIKADVPQTELPAVPGRRYLAVAESSVEMKCGAVAVGTKDTVFAIVKDGKAFSFGQVISAGGIHSLDVASDGTVWGVAGHREGCGMLFKYTEELGVTLLGIIPEAFAENGRNVAIYRPTRVAVSPDGKHIAVGGADEISGIVILRL